MRDTRGDNVICFKKKECVDIDVSKFDEYDNYLYWHVLKLDDLEYEIPLMRKHNLRAFNFAFDSTPFNFEYIACTIVGKIKDLENFHADNVLNREYYTNNISAVFNNKDVPEFEIKPESKEEIVEKAYRNPPKRMPYDPKTHKFMQPIETSQAQ